MTTQPLIYIFIIVVSQKWHIGIKKQIHFYDAPISGGEKGAIDGTLTAMVGGSGIDFGEVEKLIKSYCKAITYIGEPGAGQVTKMANQLCIAGILAGISEAVKLLDGEEINSHKAFAAISQGAAQSWQLTNRIDTILANQFDFGFAINHMIKDLGYAISHAEKQDWSPTVAKLVRSYYENLVENGFGNDDTSILVNYYKHLKRD